MISVVALAAKCDGSTEAWRAIAACGRGRRGGAVLKTVAAEVVRSGLRCIAKGWTVRFENDTVASVDGVTANSAAYNAEDEEIVSLISALVGNVLFYSQADASAADPTAVLLSSILHPSHLIPLVNSPTSSHEAMKVAALASGKVFPCQKQ
jgi:hypothetical protein